MTCMVMGWDVARQSAVRASSDMACMQCMLDGNRARWDRSTIAGGDGRRELKNSSYNTYARFWPFSAIEAVDIVDRKSDRSSQSRQASER